MRGQRLYDEAGLDALVALHQDELPPPGGAVKDARTQWPLELQTKKEHHRSPAEGQGSVHGTSVPTW